MSGYTQTTNEVVFSYDQPATVSVVSASAVTITAAYPAMKLYGSNFKNTGELSTSMRFKMGGLLTSSSGGPTFTFALYTTSVTPPAFATTNTLVTSAAITPTSAVTNAWWHMEVDIALRTLSLGAASTMSAHGEIRSGAGFASPFIYSLPTTGAYAPLATYETDLQYFLWPGLTLSAATAGNTVTVQYAKLYGEN